jgi:isochorismate hydrolase
MLLRLLSLLVALAIASCSWLYYKAYLHDSPLSISSTTIRQLAQLRANAKFTDLPGNDTRQERERNESNLNELLDRLVAGLTTHPSKRWVILQMEPTVERMYLEDTEARERFVDYLVEVNKIVGISSTDGAFATKLIFF